VDRIATFQSFIARSPKDPFPRYGLAMEYKTRGQLDDARAAFAELIELFPDYVPSYLHAASIAAEIDQKRALLRRGIDAATMKADLHARKELEAALAEVDG
jgi:hypothetical protein